MVHVNPFLEPAFGDIATEKGEDLSGTQLYHRAKFNDKRRHHRRDICPFICPVVVSSLAYVSLAYIFMVITRLRGC